MYSNTSDLVIIDFDDVLIDCYKSYLMASIRTVTAYLTGVLGVKDDGTELLSVKEVEQFANAYGFKPGYDLAYALLLYFLSVLDEEYPEDEFAAMDPKSILETIKQDNPIRESLADLKKRKRLSDLGRVLRMRGGGLHALNKLVDLRNRFLAFNEGHITMDNYLHRVFEEVYLGEELFHTEYGQSRLFSRDAGTIHMEEPRFTLEQFNKLRSRGRLATVTERSQARTRYLLNLLGLERFFSAVVSSDSTGSNNSSNMQYGVEMLGVADTRARNFTAELVTAIERVSANNQWGESVRIIYVGDTSQPEKDLSMIKDRYRLSVIGFSLDRRKKKELKDGGADYVAFDTKQVIRLLTDKNKMKVEQSPWG